MTQPQGQLLTAPNDAGHARVAALDGLRGFAVLWVMLHHFLMGASHHNILLRGVFSFGHYGYWGVDIFFVLSGFLITGILYDSKSADNYYSSFYARRALRILPLYYAVLLGVFVIAPLIFIFTPQQIAMQGQQLWMWLYCGNIAMVVKDAPIYDAGGIKLLHFWSLAIEEQFYLVWPAVVMICSRRRLMQVCVALVGVAIASRMVVDWMGVSPQMGSLFTLSRVDGLALGALTALLVRGPGGLPRWTRNAYPLAAICAIVLAAAMLAHGREWAGQVPRYATSLSQLGLFAAVLLLAVGGSPSSWTRRVFSQRWLCFFGKYSYALYVFHYMMLPLFNRFMSASEMTRIFHSFALGMFVRVTICTAVSLLVALASWNLMEKHFLKLKPLFDARRKSHPKAAAEIQSGTTSATAVAPVAIAPEA